MKNLKYLCSIFNVARTIGWDRYVDYYKKEYPHLHKEIAFPLKLEGTSVYECSMYRWTVDLLGEQCRSDKPNSIIEICFSFGFLQS